MRFI
ncbi:unnamed protein product, partial [Onchocerca ochengi]|jgi:hypothetical protein